MNCLTTSVSCSSVLSTTEGPVVHRSISAGPKSLRVRPSSLAGTFVGRSIFGDHAHRFVVKETIRRVDRPTTVSAALMTDHFVTLGVTQNASLREIKSAYRQLAKRYHPDVCRGKQSKFLEINNAYEHALNCVSGVQYASNNCEEGDYGEECRAELEDWESWMGWEGAGTLDFAEESSSMFGSY